MQFIADIHLGQDAKVTPSTFDTRTQRSLNGKVTHIEPDASTPENGEPYYLVTVSFDGEEFSSRIKPGWMGQELYYSAKERLYSIISSH